MLQKLRLVKRPFRSRPKQCDTSIIKSNSLTNGHIISREKYFFKHFSSFKNMPWIHFFSVFLRNMSKSYAKKKAGYMALLFHDHILYAKNWTKQLVAGCFVAFVFIAVGKLKPPQILVLRTISNFSWKGANPCSHRFDIELIRIKQLKVILVSKQP